MRAWGPIDDALLYADRLANWKTRLMTDRENEGKIIANNDEFLGARRFEIIWVNMNG